MRPISGASYAPFGTSHHPRQIAAMANDDERRCDTGAGNDQAR
jgi:hypothetical protein